MANLERIINDLDTLTSAQKGELVQKLEDAWGIECPKEPELPDWYINPEPAEQTSFEVVLTGTTNRIKTIKAVKQLMSLDLKGSRDLVEAVPQVLQADLSKEAAEELKEKFEEEGAEVEIR